MDNNNFKQMSSKVKSNNRKQLVQEIADNCWTPTDLITIILELKNENTNQATMSQQILTTNIFKWSGEKLTIQELEEAYILMSQTKEVFRKNFEELKIQIKKGVAGDELNDLIKELDKEVILRD